MTSEDFTEWLKGFFEISGAKTLNQKQIGIIKNHIAMVFKHEIDPSFGNEEHLKELDKLHHGQPYYGDHIFRC